jgi:glutamate synthase (NADPH/NADH) small chain
MGKPTGFVEIKRQNRTYRPVTDRIRHFEEFIIPLEEGELKKQGARCMDCGIPYCHDACPLHNVIPDWNDLTYRGRWREALRALHSTNNFPEFTGRVCPAPCEAGCTLNITDEPVTIKTIECALVDKAWEEGWIEPQTPEHRTGKRVAIVGSGPAGLACAQQLARAGHGVVVIEKNPRIGGLLRFGIPNFKLDKRYIDMRMSQMQAEGVRFVPGVHIGVDFPVERLIDEYDAVVMAGGAEHPRDLPVPGRDLCGVHFAMDFLVQQNRRMAGEQIPDDISISAYDRRVVVIGGGDTGADCVGTSIRQGARWVSQIEIMPMPPKTEDRTLTWPNWPSTIADTTSHEEGCQRDWQVQTTGFRGRNGSVEGIDVVRVKSRYDANDALVSEEMPGTEFTLRADLVLLAMGFLHPVREGMVTDFGVALDPRGNVLADTTTYRTSVDKVFTAGDMRRGQSLVVWAMAEGRGCARAVDLFLTGDSNLPT